MSYVLPVSPRPDRTDPATVHQATVTVELPGARPSDVERLAVAALVAVLHRYGARGEIGFPVGDRYASAVVGEGSWAELAAGVRYRPVTAADSTEVTLRPDTTPDQVVPARVGFGLVWSPSSVDVICAAADPVAGPDECARMAGQLAGALGSALREPSGAVIAGVPLEPGEAELVRSRAVPTTVFPPDGTLASRFRATAARYPDRVAVSSGATQLCYVELLDRAERLAASLRARGVERGDLVGLAAPRSAELIVGLVGIILAGAAYVPVDPDYPPTRRQAIIDDAGLSLVVGERDLRPDAGHPTTAELPEPRPDDIAYVIYTSGSTGQPKGVAVTHHNVLRLFNVTAVEVHPGPDDVWTMFHSYAFDFSVWEIWGALLHGGRLVIVAFDVSRDPAAVRGLVRDEGVTIFNQTPSALYQFVGDGTALHPSALRLVILGGEAVDPSRLKPWFASPAGRQARLVNMYGITETTVHVTWRELTGSDVASSASPIGVPLADLGVRLSDEFGRTPPVGIVGELLVCGAGLARGYLHAAELTATKFRTDADGVRWYHSGDRASLQPGGEFVYAGRGDRQVKIRGFRIELGDVEAALQDHPSVGRAVAVAAEGPGGRAALAAFVAATNAGLTPGELKAFAQRRLPAHMVPAKLIVLPQLPLTINGKVDSKALLAQLEAAPRPSSTMDDPDRLGEVASRLADIWTELLGVRPRGGDSFFDLGGDSLSLVDMLDRATRAGLELELADVFAGRTLAELARESTAPAGARESTVEREATPTVAEIWAGLPTRPPGAARIVTVRRGTDPAAVPFFGVHWGTGNAGFLARIPADPEVTRAMIGVEAVGLHDGARPLLDPTEVGAHVARAVLDTGADRIHLGGFCYGALIAVTAAERLAAAGVEVASLVLADAVPPDPRDPSTGWTLDDFLRFRLGMVAQRYGTDRARTLAQMAELGVADPGEGLDRFLALQALWAANGYVQARWQPTSYPGPVLLAASESHREDAVTASWTRWLDADRVTELFCADAPESHDLLTSPTFHRGLHRYLRAADQRREASVR